MVNLLIGPKGTGKTQIMIDLANKAVKDCNGNVVFIKKSHQDTFNLSFDIRVICMDDYAKVTGADTYLGFIYGMLSANHDIEAVFIDGLLKHSGILSDHMPAFIEELKNISKNDNVDFYVSLSAEKDSLAGVDMTDCTLLN